MNKLILVILLSVSFFSFANNLEKNTNQENPTKKGVVSFVDNNNNYIHCVIKKEDNSMECRNQNEDIVVCSNSDQNGFTCSSN